jgi:menaquinol-cytochrome c reductase iron-sulfur subunit
LTDHDQPHLPPPSLWPIGFAIGIACVLTGIVVSTIVAIVGAVIAIVFGFLWIRDVTRPVRAPAADVEPETREERALIEPVDDEPEAYPRSTFLSVATLGLGGVIGGLVTLPVLGFAVLPSFTNPNKEEAELGPIEDFPEGEFVITTYLANPNIGDVTRRTMFIRNNGYVDGVPSFTTLYSRCAHLGCPVQPNGLQDEDRKKKIPGENQVELTPVLVTGFGCPCHGGQYDTEGNRVAGPPVRALDRAEFSIKDGKLYLGTFFSVAVVEGAGARPRIYRYGRQVPGVHVDGPEAWLYPIEVPR